MEFRDRDVWLAEGEMIVVPAASNTVPSPKRRHTCCC